jgi:hypothetical protein
VLYWFLWPLIAWAIFNSVICLPLLALGIASRLTRASRIARIRSAEQAHYLAERAPGSDAYDEGFTSGSRQQAAAL